MQVTLVLYEENSSYPVTKLQVDLTDLPLVGDEFEVFNGHFIVEKAYYSISIIRNFWWMFANVFKAKAEGVAILRGTYPLETSEYLSK
jgi:hypothetical protein